MTAYSLGGSAGFSTIRTTPLAVELGDAEVAQVLGLVQAREQDPAAALLAPEVLDRRRERALDDVVGEHDHDPVAAAEALGEAERLRDPARPVLVGVEEPVDPVLVPVAEQPEELARVRPAGDEHQLGDARA